MLTFSVLTLTYSENSHSLKKHGSRKNLVGAWDYSKSKARRGGGAVMHIYILGAKMSNKNISKETFRTSQISTKLQKLDQNFKTAMFHDFSTIPNPYVSLNVRQFRTHVFLSFRRV